MRTYPKLVSIAALALLAVSGNIAFAQSADRIVVNVADANLAKRITVLQANIVQDGLMSTAIMQISNTSTRPVDLTYFAEWSKDSGIPLKPEQTNSVWETLRVDGSTQKSVTITGRHPSAKKVLVTIKPSS